jgi:L-alanine-DL-glutamate epimerase-like enolase superfamily enzyme
MDRSWQMGFGVARKKDELLVVVETDEGITGYGVSYHGYSAKAVEAIVQHEIRPIVIGCHALDVQGMWDRVFSGICHLGAGAALAMSGIDIALWDIVGKKAGLPLYQVLGAAGVDRVPVYVGCMTLGIQETETLVAEAVGYAEQGYQAIKLRGGAGVRRDLAAVRAVREALPDIDIMIDANSAYAWPDALTLGDRLAEYDVRWLEDPFDYTTPFHHQQMGRLSQQSRTAIASGGNLFTRFELQSLIEAGGCQYVTPDAVKCGGITEGLRMAAMASASGILVAPHTVAGLSGVANLHMTAAIPTNVRCYMEWDPTLPNPLNQEIIAPGLRVEAGQVLMPTGPGLGLEPDLAAVDRYPFQPGKEISGDTRGEAARLAARFSPTTTTTT